MNFPKHITGLRELDKQTIELILRKTSEYLPVLEKKSKNKKDLSDYSVINFFLEDSTRTRVSFEQAENLMNMKVVNFASGGSSLSKGESVLDTIRNIDAMKFDFIVSRANIPGFPSMLIKNTSARIINGGDGINEHPTQGLLDIYTIQSVFKKLEGLKVCIIGNISHSRVAMSNIYGLLKLGAKVSVCGPAPFIPRNLGSLGIKIYYDVDEAIAKNQVINVLRVQKERNAAELLSSIEEYKSLYGINKKRLSRNKKIRVLHPGPWNKNVEIDEDIIDAEDSLIFKQVTNGVAVKMALFDLMTNK